MRRGARYSELLRYYYHNRIAAEKHLTVSQIWWIFFFRTRVDIDGGCAGIYRFLTGGFVAAGGKT